MQQKDSLEQISAEREEGIVLRGLDVLIATDKEVLGVYSSLAASKHCRSSTSVPGLFLRGWSCFAILLNNSIS